nr:DNA-directed RNA polymerases I and III subunit RPAc1 [Andalucia godoyi]|eukprot:ANDGO_03321.mRNA.1 DNA-directed RNA polymerases I and III subunit rpac1
MAPTLPSHLQDIRDRVTIGREAPANTEAFVSSNAFSPSGIDNSFVLSSFKDGFSIRIIEKSFHHLVFDMVGIDAPLANAFRRILLGEVPTFAIEYVDFIDNTSIIADENLAHRLGLVPLNIDPRKYPEDKEFTFALKATCKRKPGADADSDVQVKYENAHVYSSSLICISDPEIRPVHEDILIAKLRPGQSIEFTCIAKKGMGSVHAKWSPVATATYRMLPAITIVDEEFFRGENAKELVKRCPMGVYDIEDGHAIVAKPRNCTMCRECIREKGWEDKIKLQRLRQHFVFSIESVGMMSATDIFRQATDVLIKKCASLHEDVGKV